MYDILPKNQDTRAAKGTPLRAQSDGRGAAVHRRRLAFGPMIK
jgi:hypothetical protein